MATDYPIRYTGTVNPIILKKSLEYSQIEHLHDVNMQPSTNAIFVTRHAIQYLQSRPEYQHSYIKLYELENSSTDGVNTSVQFSITGDAPYYGVGVEPNFGIKKYIAQGSIYGTDCSVSNLMVGKVWNKYNILFIKIIY